MSSEVPLQRGADAPRARRSARPIWPRARWAKLFERLLSRASRAVAACAGAGSLSGSGTVGALELSFSHPDFALTIPSLPQFSAARDEPPSQGAARMSGTDGVYTLTVDAADMNREVGARECAGIMLRAIVARPGMPNRDGVYRAPLSEKTFLVIYILEGGGGAQMHAHLLSSAGRTRCVDAHVQRAMRDGEDEDDWRKAFAGSRIDARAP